MEKIQNLSDILVGFEISNNISRYEILAEFLKQAGRLFYIKQSKGGEITSEDVEIFSAKFEEFQTHIEKICSK
jgi:hypothetical protein